jgi:hypothetical protein
VPDPPTPLPPLAPARPHALRHGNDERGDPWFWLGRRDDRCSRPPPRTTTPQRHLGTSHRCVRLFTEIVQRPGRRLLPNPNSAFSASPAPSRTRVHRALSTPTGRFRVLRSLYAPVPLPAKGSSSTRTSSRPTTTSPRWAIWCSRRAADRRSTPTGSERYTRSSATSINGDARRRVPTYYAKQAASGIYNPTTPCVVPDLAPHVGAASATCWCSGRRTLLRGHRPIGRYLVITSA